MDKPKVADYVQIAVIIVSAVWAISTIKATTETLGIRIDNLKESIVDLKNSIGVQKTDIDELKKRVLILELGKK